MSAKPPTESPSPAAQWNRRYAEEGYLFGEEPKGWLKEHAAVWSPGDWVLCVADGEGRTSVWLAQQGLTVRAFDSAEAGVAKARRLAAGRGVDVDFAVGDVDSYPWPPAALDGVAAIFVQFADPELRTRLLVRIVRSLKPGGHRVLQGCTPQQLAYGTGGPSQLANLYTEAMLREPFADLELLSVVEDEADLAEGSGHHGRSALIGLVVCGP
jgi:SAM-dependent methyltransferase